MPQETWARGPPDARDRDRDGGGGGGGGGFRGAGGMGGFRPPPGRWAERRAAAEEGGGAGAGGGGNKDYGGGGGERERGDGGGGKGFAPRGDRGDREKDLEKWGKVCAGVCFFSPAVRGCHVVSREINVLGRRRCCCVAVAIVVVAAAANFPLLLSCVTLWLCILSIMDFFLAHPHRHSHRCDRFLVGIDSHKNISKQLTRAETSGAARLNPLGWTTVWRFPFAHACGTNFVKYFLRTNSQRRADFRQEMEVV